MMLPSVPGRLPLAVLLLLAHLASPGQGQPGVPGFHRLLSQPDQARTNPAVASAAGRLLLSELHCLRCHAATPDQASFLVASRAGPVLDGLASRVRADWLRAFLLQPQQTMPGATHPDLLHHLTPEHRADTVENLLHYLLARPGAPPTKMRHGDPVFGGRLYHELGCAACHAADPHTRETPHDHLLQPLPDLPRKYSLDSLTEYLLNPTRRHPHSQILSHGLNRDEASDIASFLVQHEPSQPADEWAHFEIDLERGKAGREAYVSHQCGACHAQSGGAQPEPGPALGQLSSGAPTGCLKNGSPRAPRYLLTPLQSLALQMALEDLRNTTTSVPPPPGQTLELHLAAHHCYACHTRGDREGIHASREPFFVGDDSLGNDGRWPPPLTGAGGKLNPTWIREVIEGKVRPRTYLRTRMPHYAPALAEVFTDLIQRADQPLQAQAPTATWLESGDLEAGRLLVGVEGGMGCITCHGWKDHPGLTMNALNLSTAPQRLQPGWFQQYLLSPQTFRPGTIMPSFWPDGQSAHPGVLGGDTSRQIASIWRFLKEGVAEPGGYPEQVAGAYELQPTLQAIVQRGFIEPAGTHAIAVGFTNHLNLLFDADSCRPVAVWRGRFINAYQLWFSRLKPTAEPLAPPHLLNANPILQVLSPSPAPLRFQGYRLEGADRHPVFLYRIGLVTVMDRITPTHEAKGVRRHLTLSTSQEGVILQFAPHISSVTAEDHDRIKSPIKLSPGQPLTLTIHHP